MRKYKLVNNENEEISFNIPLSNVIENRSGDKEGAIHISDANRIFQLGNQCEDDFDNNKYTINSSQDFKYSDGETTQLNTLVKHKGQTFLCAPQFGRADTTETMPNMYSMDWVAVSDVQHGKFIGRDAEDLGDYNRINNSNAIDNLVGALTSYNFYDYFNDGDWYALTTLNDHIYTMRINYNEWTDSQGRTYMSVDAISDEVIPTIRYKVNGVIEKESTQELESFTRASNLSVFGRVFDSLLTYKDRNLTGLKFKSSGLIQPYVKWRNYHGYDRDSHIKKGGCYTVNNTDTYYLDELDSQYKKNMYEVPNIWLPNEKEVFGVSYNCICPPVEASFRQYKTLDTAFKRVKTLNGKPVPWMTMSMYKNRLRPVVVDTNGNEVSYEYWDSHGGFNEFVYLPLCVTLITIQKDYR